jgi:hypothetical protein
MFERSHLAATGAALLFAMPATAFTFSDGTTLTCIAQGEPVTEVFAGPDDPEMRGRTGKVARVGERWQIKWNEARLKSLPPDLHDFLFFHECAHARVPTEVELEANCVGLVEMRAAGRAGPRVESTLRSLYGREPYWINTFRCADAAGAQAAPNAPK